MQRTRRINGEREISLSFLSSTINDPFIYDIDMRWQIKYKGEDYIVIDPQKETDDGNNIVVSVKAVKKFFVDNNAIRLFNEADQKSMTAMDYFLDTYRDSNKWVNVVDNFYANRVTLTKGDTLQERHNKGLQYYDMEQVVSADSSRVDLYNQIGRELDKVFHEDLNMRNFKWNMSSSGFHTYARGFGKQNEDGSYVATAEYLSPLANIYGKIEGPHIEDERFTDETSLKKSLEKQVDNSFEVSNSFDVEDLKHHGYTIHDINEGDHVWSVSKKMKLKLQLRIIEIQESFDVNEELIGASYTVGNKAITQSYKAQQRSMLYQFTASLKGNRKLSKSVLPGAVMFYTNLLNEARSYFQYLPTGVIGIDQNDPLKLIKIVHNGMGISDDGGKSYKTAVTGAGIVADVINTGVLNANLVKIQGADGLFYIDGDVLKATNDEDPEVYSLISNGKFHSNKGAFSLTGYDGRGEYFNGIRQYDQSMIIQQFNNRAIAQWTDRDMITKVTDEWARVYVVWESFDGQYLRLSGAARLGEGSARNESAMDIRIWQMGEDREMVRQRKVITKSFGLETGWAFDFDLKDFFSKNTSDIAYPGYPDKRQLNLYIEFKLASNPDEGDTGVFRVNRGWMYG